jgi:hypothetical protein
MMHKQLGKVGAVRREVHGKPCRGCGGRTYQLVLRSKGTLEPAGLFARCIQCQRPRGVDDDFGKILWM